MKKFLTISILLVIVAAALCCSVSLKTVVRRVDPGTAAPAKPGFDIYVVEKDGGEYILIKTDIMTGKTNLDSEWKKPGSDGVVSFWEDTAKYDTNKQEFVFDGKTYKCPEDPSVVVVLDGKGMLDTITIDGEEGKIDTVDKTIIWEIADEVIDDVTLYIVELMRNGAAQYTLLKKSATDVILNNGWEHPESSNEGKVSLYIGNRKAEYSPVNGDFAFDGTTYTNVRSKDDAEVTYGNNGLPATFQVGNEIAKDVKLCNGIVLDGFMDSSNPLGYCVIWDRAKDKYAFVCLDSGNSFLADADPFVLIDKNGNEFFESELQQGLEGMAYAPFNGKTVALIKWEDKVNDTTSESDYSYAVEPETNKFYRLNKNNEGGEDPSDMGKYTQCEDHDVVLKYFDDVDFLEKVVVGSSEVVVRKKDDVKVVKLPEDYADEKSIDFIIQHFESGNVKKCSWVKEDDDIPFSIQHGPAEANPLGGSYEGEFELPSRCVYNAETNKISDITSSLDETECATPVDGVVILENKDAYSPIYIIFGDKSGTIAIAE